MTRKQVDGITIDLKEIKLSDDIDSKVIKDIKLKEGHQFSKRLITKRIHLSLDNFNAVIGRLNDLLEVLK